MNRQPAIEMTADPRFARRVIRLALTSVVALGLIFVLGTATSPGTIEIALLLGAGWVLMPSVLLLSLWWPGLRYAVIVPAAMVSLGLLAICLWHLPPALFARLGWLLISGGVLLGGLLGAWFWFRWFPVPDPLHDPYARGRWALISAHVALIVVGLGFVTLSTVS